jgi:hypothetical protein
MLDPKKAAGGQKCSRLGPSEDDTESDDAGVSRDRTVFFEIDEDAADKQRLPGNGQRVYPPISPSSADEMRALSIPA